MEKSLLKAELRGYEEEKENLESSLSLWKGFENPPPHAINGFKRIEELKEMIREVMEELYND